MANRYWVGGTGNWDSTTTTNWSATSGGSGGASVPTSADIVTFDSASNATAYTVTVTSATNPPCSDLSIAGPASGNLTFAGSSSAIVVQGNFTIAATGVVFTFSAGITFAGTASGKTITTNGISIPSGITINGNAGAWTLGSALTLSGSLTINNGSFTTNNFAVSCAFFNVSVATAATINLGSSAITAGSNTTAWNMAGTTGLTFNAGTSTITLTGASTVQSAYFGTLTYYNVQLTGVSSGKIITFQSTGTIFNNLSITATADDENTVIFAGNNTVNGTFTFNGGVASRILFKSNTTGSARTITAAAVSISYCDFQDITAAGAATWSGTSVGDCGGNSSFTFAAGKTVYWVGATGSNFTGNFWASSSGGAALASNYPLAQDTAIVDNATTGTMVLGTITGFQTGSLNTSARTTTFSFTINGTLTTYGNITLSSTSTTTNSSNLIFNKRGAQTITCNGGSFGNPLIFSTLGGSVSFADTFTSTSTITHQLGTWNTNNFNVTATTLNTNQTGVRAINFGSSLITLSGSGASVWSGAAVTNLTFNAGTSTVSFTSASAKTMNIGAIAVYKINQGGAGALTINNSSATFNDIQNSYSSTGAATITLAANLSTANFTATGTVGKVLTLNSSTAGTAITITKTGGGTITGLNYLNVTDIAFTPFVTNGTAPYVWYAGANSTNNGNVSGIVFTASTQTAYLLASGTSFTTPVDWNNSSNTIHIFGAGGGGAGSRATAPKAAGAGGGGGGYTGLTNQTLSGAITYAIGAGGTAGAVSGGAGGTGGTTSWNSGASTATGGTGGTVTATPTSTGGTGGTGTYSGGAGGAGATSATAGDTVAGGGAGGAGGPNGIGGAGGVGFGSATTTLAASGAGGGNGGGTAGGNGSSGVGGTGGNNFLGTGGGAQNTAGTLGGGGGGAVNATGKGGGAGVDISSTIGGGGGPSGGSYSAGATAGVAGALYGAGGSGGASSGGNTTSGGAGGAGMIFIIYTPGAVATNTGNFFFLMN